MQRLVAICFMLMLSGAAAAQQAGPLHQAVRAGDGPRVEALLKQGTAPDARDEQRQTPLLLAVQGNHLSIARLLLAAGADINAQASNRDTPWLLAGASGRAEMLKDMIPRGPDLAIRNRFGGNALIPACERAHVEAIKELLTTAIDLNHVNDLGWTCLLEIVILGSGGQRHQEATRLVLAAGADPNIADRDGTTPLAHARAKGQKDIAEMISASGGRIAR